MAPNLAGKVAFVTGGSRGIGKGVSEAFLEKGIKVCFADVNTAAGEETLGELQAKHGKENVMFLKCDVTSEKEFEESLTTTIGKFGHLDILINNAGILMDSDWEKTIDINLKGVMRGTMLAFKHLSNRDGKKGGTVINTGSVLSFETAPFMPAYCASKFGVGAWTRCWGDELNVKRTGVKVCGVCPDATDTSMLWNVVENSVDKTAAKAMLDSAKDHTLTPADIAKAFVKSLEDEVSGTLLYVNAKKEMKYVENPAGYNP